MTLQNDYVESLCSEESVYERTSKGAYTYLQCLILISAFLASVNPPSFDSQIFKYQRVHRMRKGGRAPKLKPKKFPIYRLLAIIHYFISTVDQTTHEARSLSHSLQFQAQVYSFFYYLAFIVT